ncbi:MAG: DUF502 domain-containing protein [Elusimicrobiota bacterium]|jgi:uncharacterized membrane protein|nr:DUF502 domain-containing protein [Elusimicrobiota bacterium]
MENNEEHKTTLREKFAVLIKKHLVMGIIIIIPLWLTYFVASILFNWTSSFTFPVINVFTSDKRWVYIIAKASSFFLSIALVCLLGFFTNKVLGKNVINFFESLLGKIPMLGAVYFAAKQFVHFIFTDDKSKGFKQVVFVPYPTDKSYCAAFLANEQFVNGEKRYCVFMPTTPNPSTGFLMLYKKEDVIFTKYTIEEAFQFIISVGVISLDSAKQGEEIEEIQEQIEKLKDSATEDGREEN